MGYMGSKNGAGVYQAIIAAMPPHDTYIETHLGSGAILSRKPACARTIGLDLDGRMIARARATWDGEFIKGDCVEFLEHFDFASAGRVLIYADPPYLLGPGEVRGGSKRYRHDYTRADHVRLLDVLRHLPCAVMISGYGSALYAGELRGWRCIQFQTMTRGGVRTECLWLNYPADKAHWATFAGRNYTKRQHVKRMAARWAGKYRKLPPAVRLAVLAAIMNEEGPAA